MNITPLNAVHRDLGAKMVSFGGWDMPVHYDGILAEHHATRNNVGIFDICHMGEFMVKGPGSTEFLNRVLTTNIKTLAVGKCRYGLLLNDEGKIQDDLITYRLGETEYMLVVNASPTQSDLEWLIKHKPDDVSIRDVSEQMGKLDLQGPKSREIIEKAFKITLKELGYFSWEGIGIEINECDVEIIISRTGYTGELGFELYFSADAAETIWDLFLENGAVPIGLGARDTLRLEASLPLSGQDMDITRTPAEGNFMKFIRKTTDFIGKAGITPEKDLTEILVGFKIEGRRSARHNMKVLKNGEEIGIVTSGSYAPTLECSIGLAYVKPEYQKVGTEIEIDMGKKTLKAIISEMPFYSNVK